MNVEELKKQIESNDVKEDSFVFVYKKSRFLAEQYAKEIAKIRNLTIVYDDDYIEDNSFFCCINDGNLYVCIVDSFDSKPKKNHIIITKKSRYDDAVSFPELESWQIKDYLFSKCSGADESVLTKLFEKCKDIYGLENEICKLSIFDERMRKSLSVDFLESDVFPNVFKTDTFDFINAVQRRSTDSIREMYAGYDKDPMSFIGLMYKQFKNMVNVYLQKTPTEENTGLKSNQIYAIRKVCQNYTKQQVLDIFKFLCSLDAKLKSGELPSDCLFDYVLVKVLSI